MNFLAQGTSIFIRFRDIKAASLSKKIATKVNFLKKQSCFYTVARKTSSEIKRFWR